MNTSATMTKTELPARNRVDQVLWGLAIVAPLAYLLLLPMRPYPGAAVLKTTMCVLLALLAWRHGRRLFSIALLLSAAGDAFLGIDGERYFIPGLVSFLLTHVVYTALFVRAAPAERTAVRGWRILAAVVIPAFAIGFAVTLWPKLGALALPVVLYTAVIVAMAMASLRMAAIAIPLGALFFMTSDSLLSLEKFIGSPGWVGPVVWATYAIAQLLIVHGMLQPSPVRDVGRVTTGSA
jgi:uncharacterized membrane protein YhhN